MGATSARYLSYCRQLLMSAMRHSFSSICESLSQGVPLIVWPTAGDQAFNAALLSSEPNPVAIELMQVRFSVFHHP
jgi:hypothetical protein